MTADHLPHYSPAVCALIAQAEQRGAERVLRAVEGLAEGAAKHVALEPIEPWDRGWRQAHRKVERDLRALVATHRAEHPAPEAGERR